MTSRPACSSHAWPVSLLSNASSTAAPATSTGMIGTPEASSVLLIPVMIFVSAKPGQKAFTVMPCPA